MTNNFFVSLILCFCLVSTADTQSFGVTTDNAFSYTLLQAYDYDTKDRTLQFEGYQTSGEVIIPIGGTFTVSPFSLQIEDFYYIGKGITIEISYHESQILTYSLIYGWGFFIKLNWDGIRAGDNSSEYDLL